MTTWVSVGVMSGTEIAPVMAYAFMAMGIIPALFLKMAITAEGGRVLLQYSPSLVTVLALAFWIIGLSNLAGVGLMVAVDMGFYA